MKTVTYTSLAAKVLNRMQPKLAARIRDKVQQYAADPASQADNIKALQGSSYIRLRVGDWRVIMDDRSMAVLYVIEVGSRGGIYK